MDPGLGCSRVEVANELFNCRAKGKAEAHRPKEYAGSGRKSKPESGRDEWITHSQSPALKFIGFGGLVERANGPVAEGEMTMDASLVSQFERKCVGLSKS